MPYANREKQLSYMRNYMKRKRMENRLERLKQRKQRLLEECERDPLIKLFIESQGIEVGSYIDKEIEKLEGLLKN